MGAAPWPPTAKRWASSTSIGGYIAARIMHGGCSVLVSVSGGTFDADFVLTADAAERLASVLQKAAAMARKVAREVRAAADKGTQ